MADDFFGPASDLAVTVRPSLVPATPRLGGAPTYFARCSSKGADDGTMIDAEWSNLIIANLEAVRTAAGITSADVTPGADDTLLASILALIVNRSPVHVGLATGTADAITVDVSPSLTSWSSGAVLLVRIAAANTLISPTLAPDGLAAKTIVNADGSALGLGDLAAATWAWMVYDAALDRLMLMPTEAYIARTQRQPWFRLSGTPNNIPSGVRTVLTGWPANASGNMTGMLNAGAGIFTVGAADAGTWILEMCANTSIASNEEQAGLSVNGAAVTVQGSSTGGAAVNDLDMACSAIVRLVAGDVVASTYYQGSGAWAAMNSNGIAHFSGTRVGI